MSLDQHTHRLNTLFPIKIDAGDFVCENYNDNESIIRTIKKCFDENRIQNHNSVDVLNDIIDQVNNMEDRTKYVFTKRNHCVVSCSEGPVNIGRMFNDRNNSGEYGQSCGFNQNDLTKPHQICFWNIQNDNYNHLGINKGDVFLLFRVQKDAGEDEDAGVNKNIHKTKDKCAFHQEIVHEDGESEETNGNYGNRLPCDSGFNVNVMENFLADCIKLSIDPTYPQFNSRCVRSEKSADNAYKGIMVNAEVLKALTKNGTIYNNFLETFNVKIEFKRNYYKLKGQSNDMFRLSKIEW